MKQVNQVFLNDFDKSHSVSADARVTMTISHNRYSDATADNIVPEELEGYDVDLFPIDSIIEPNRPGTGITKMMVGQTTLGDETTMPASINDNYKYWVSPEKSDPSGSIVNAAPHVRYNVPALSNKIVIGLETTQAFPTDTIVAVVLEPEGEWFSVTDTPKTDWVFDDEGRLVLYYDGDEWTTTRNLDNPIPIYGVGIFVQEMSEPNARLSVLEIGAELEVDISDHIISINDISDAGDDEDLMPVGRSSANTASIELFNVLVDEDDPELGFLYDGDNENSPYFGLTESNVEFRCEYVIQADTTQETIQQFIMYADNRWNAGTEESVTIDATDGAKFLQEIKSPKMVMENYRSDKIVERLLHNAGFNKYEIDDDFRQYFPILTYFWTTGDTYLWEELQALSYAHQIGFWFDAYGVLRVQPREQIYNSVNVYEPVQTIRASEDGDFLPNISEGSFSLEKTHRSNVVNVNYKDTTIQMNNYGDFLRTEAWNPGDDIIIGASDLMDNFTMGQLDITMRADDIETWPYEGMFNVGGEICSYSGKELKYSLKDEVTNVLTAHTVILHSPQEYRDILNKVGKQNLQHLMYFTGKLIVTERGIYNSTQRDHLTLAPNGMGQSYNPLNKVTRADFALMLYDFSGNPAVSPSGQRFTDIPTSHALYRETWWMYQTGISEGFRQPNKTTQYRPATYLNRADLSAFLYRHAGKPAFTPPKKSPFIDVPTTALHYKPMCWMYSKGITTGWVESNGRRSFRPNEALLRDQLAAFMYRYANSPTYTPPATSPFLDVPKTRTFYKEICWITSQGYLPYTNHDAYRMVRALRNSPSSTSAEYPLGARPGTVANFDSTTSVISTTPGKFEMTRTPTAKGNTTSDIFMITKGHQDDIPPRYYGTKLRFPSGGGNLPRAGLHFFGSGHNDLGYYVEIRPTKYDLAGLSEVRVWSRLANGTHNVYNAARTTVNEDQWYSLDVAVERSGTGDRISVMLDGALVLTQTIATAAVPPYGGRFGLFIRDSTRALFDYLYAVNGEALDPNPNTRFFDMYRGGYITDVMQKEFVASTTTYNPFKVGTMKRAQGYRQIDFYDEFGPIVHEIMSFDIDYGSPTPFLSPVLVSTNEEGIAVINPQLTPFSAKFQIGNTGRADENMHGELNDISHQTTILGYAIEQAEAQSVTVENRPSVRAHGKIELDVDSDWIQSSIDAQRLADWITNHWARARESCELEAFIPNHLEIGDLVTLDSSLDGVGESPKQYFVTRVETEWDNGLAVRLALREA